MKFDIFVSNPPYIPEAEEVMDLVKDNEPNIALFGGSDGMKFYRIILSGVKPLLKDKAIIAFEHGYDKKEEMIKLANTYFPNSKVEVLKDLENKDRMTFIYVGDFNE
jgi:release factor glutamine methyltransferase